MNSRLKVLGLFTVLAAFTGFHHVTNTETVNADISDGLLSQQVQNAKIAVIGSGIGGASAAHFLRYLLHYKRFPIKALFTF